MRPLEVYAKGLERDRPSVLGPYAILLDTNICCFHTSPSLTEPLVTYDDDHSYRRAVHSVIQVLSHGPVIEVWVHHPGDGGTRLSRVNRPWNTSSTTCLAEASWAAI